MYASASTSAIVHALVVTVGLLGWPVLNVTFNEFFGKAPQRDVLSYEEQSDFKAKYQPGALTENSGEENEPETASGIDPDDDLDTMSAGDLGFDEPGDGPQDTTKSGFPDALAEHNQRSGDEGTGLERGEESLVDGDREEEGAQGEEADTATPTREIIVFVTLRPENPNAEPVDAPLANDPGPADERAPQAVDSTGENPGELAALMSGEPTPERGTPRAGDEAGELDGEAPDARKADPTRAAGPTEGDVSPPDLPDLAKTELEGDASPDAPVEDTQTVASAVAAEARNTADEIVGAEATSDDVQETASASGQQGLPDVVDENTDTPSLTDAPTPQEQLAQTVPTQGVEGLDTPAEFREAPTVPATDENGAGLPEIGGKLSGAKEKPEDTTGPRHQTEQDEIRLSAGAPEATVNVSQAPEAVAGAAFGQGEATAETAESENVPTQMAAARPDERFAAPNRAEADRTALQFDPKDPLAKVYAAVAGDDVRLARALQDPQAGDAVGGTPDPGALKTSMLLEQAADAGLATAQLKLAKRYIVGEVDGRDPEKLVELLRNAAEQGSVEAQLLLGALFADGKVVSRDLIQSRVFFELAAAQGSQDAKEIIPLVERQMAPKEVVDSRRLAREYRRFLQTMPRPATRGDLGQGLRDQLLDAAAAGNTAKIAELLARGADLEGTDTSGRTAVINAAWRGRQDVVDMLVELGADFNVTDYDGRTALSWAASNGHTEIVNKLLGAGAETGIADNEGLTPLMRAAWNGHETIVRALIDKGAQVTDSDPKGNTALDYAAKGGHGEIVRVLRAFGA